MTNDINTFIMDAVKPINFISIISEEKYFFITPLETRDIPNKGTNKSEVNINYIYFFFILLSEFSLFNLLVYR